MLTGESNNIRVGILFAIFSGSNVVTKSIFCIYSSCGRRNGSKTWQRGWLQHQIRRLHFGKDHSQVHDGRNAAQRISVRAGSFKLQRHDY